MGSHTGFWLEEELNNFSNKKIILIEPVKYNLIELKQRTKDLKNVIIEEIAISDKDEIVPFYHIKRSSIKKLKKHWASGIGSFDINHILNHKNKRFQVTREDIEQIQISCLSFSSLIKKYEIKKVDKLMMDVEGAEYKILKSINYNEVDISQIIFEKKHFDGSFSEGKKLGEIKNILITNGYYISDIDKENILAKK
ncbi:FkbM family methyltransferase [Pelagibacteraceae bacterium]|nr:FkbM family methyltransferase [Pelagibacteraceae bacterium]